MFSLFESLPFIVAAVLVVSVVYARWLWTRFRAGRYDVLWTSGIIVCMQFMAAFTTTDPPVALFATVYHGALICAVYAASRDGIKADARS